jgi:hypothetical protein
VVTSYDGAATAMVVYKGTTVDTSNWTFSKADGANVTSSIAGNVVTITGFADAVDSGYVDITATRAGYPAQTKRFTLAKSRSAAGTSGPISGQSIFASDYDGSSPYSCLAEVNFKTDGTWESYGLNDESGFWYSPQTAGIGSSYYIKFDLLSSSGPPGGLTATLSSPMQLSSTRSVVLSGSGNREKSLKYYIYSDSGTTLVATGFVELANSTSE